MDRHFFTNKTNIAKPLEAKKDIDKENKILMLIKDLLKKVEIYIDNHLNPCRKKIGIGKGNFVQPLSISEMLAELQIADDNDYGTFFIS